MPSLLCVGLTATGILLILLHGQVRCDQTFYVTATLTSAKDDVTMTSAKRASNDVTLTTPSVNNDVTITSAIINDDVTIISAIANDNVTITSANLNSDVTITSKNVNGDVTFQNAGNLSTRPALYLKNLTRILDVSRYRNRDKSESNYNGNSNRKDNTTPNKSMIKNRALKFLYRILFLKTISEDDAEQNNFIVNTPDRPLYQYFHPESSKQEQKQKQKRRRRLAVDETDGNLLERYPRNGQLKEQVGQPQLRQQLHSALMALPQLRLIIVEGATLDNRSEGRIVPPFETDELSPHRGSDDLAGMWSIARDANRNTSPRLPPQRAGRTKTRYGDSAADKWRDGNRSAINNDRGQKLSVRTTTDVAAEVKAIYSAGIYRSINNNIKSQELSMRTTTDVTDGKAGCNDTSGLCRSINKSQELSIRTTTVGTEGKTGCNDSSGLCRSLPGAIIIGVKKGGTRALLEFLRSHPDVRASGPESHFFDRKYLLGVDWYRRQMPLSNDSQLTVEKTPSYFITPGAAERIYRMSPTTKLIVVVRDPVTRAISDYTQALSKRRPRLPPFERLALTGVEKEEVNVSWGAIRIGLYARHLEQWLRFFPRKQIHFVNGEQLITDPTAVMTSLQDFLHLPRVIRREHFHYTSAKKGFPCLIRKSTANGTSPTPVLHCLGKTKGRQHPVIDAGVVKKLRDFFRPWNRIFYRMVGTDFGWS